MLLAAQLQHEMSLLDPRKDMGAIRKALKAATPRLVALCRARLARSPAEWGGQPMSAADFQRPTVLPPAEPLCSLLRLVHVHAGSPAQVSASVARAREDVK